jgi:acyl transferase domain-containing protein
VADVRQLVATHPLQPVRFLEALHRLTSDCVTGFVEVGARQTLTSLTVQCLPRGARSVAPLARRTSSAELREFLAAVRAGRRPPRRAPRQLIR